MPKTQRTPWHASAAAAAWAPVIFPWTPARLANRPSSTRPAWARLPRAETCRRRGSDRATGDEQLTPVQLG